MKHIADMTEAFTEDAEAQDEVDSWIIRLANSPSAAENAVADIMVEIRHGDGDEQIEAILAAERLRIDRRYIAIAAGLDSIAIAAGLDSIADIIRTHSKDA